MVPKKVIDTNDRLPTNTHYLFPYETRDSYTATELKNRQRISGTTATGCHSWVDCPPLEVLGNFHTAPAPVLARVLEPTLVQDHTRLPLFRFFVIGPTGLMSPASSKLGSAV